MLFCHAGVVPLLFLLLLFFSSSDSFKGISCVLNKACFFLLAALHHFFPPHSPFSAFHECLPADSKDGVFIDHCRCFASTRSIESDPRRFPPRLNSLKPPVNLPPLRCVLIQTQANCLQHVFGFNFNRQLRKTLSHLYGNNTSDVRPGTSGAKQGWPFRRPGARFASFSRLTALSDRKRLVEQRRDQAARSRSEPVGGRQVCQSVWLANVL